MRVLRLKTPGGLENLRVNEEPRPEPWPHEILVRVYAGSLNFRDQMIVQGKLPCADGRMLLSDGAGEVIAVGDGVTEFKVGDAVVSTFLPDWLGGEATPENTQRTPGLSAEGFASEYVCRPAGDFTKAPAGYTHNEAATLTCAGVTAWRALMVCGRVKAGETVLVQGTGGVSLFALQFAKAAGARVIATSSSAEKLEKLTRLGADAVIDTKAVPEWGQKARALADDRGVDHVMEVGGPATLAQSMAAARMGGHIAIIGLLSGFTAEVSIPAIFANQLRLSGISIGSRADQRDMIRAVEATGLKPVVDRSFPMEDIAEAFRYYRSQKHFGKICLEI
jgi:NADPH:quinone reductase-like Zn-dependent oxidoreductase